jgi:hypothetical protein
MRLGCFRPLRCIVLVVEKLRIESGCDCLSRLLGMIPMVVPPTLQQPCQMMPTYLVLRLLPRADLFRPKALTSRLCCPPVDLVKPVH